MISIEVNGEFTAEFLKQHSSTDLENILEKTIAEQFAQKIVEQMKDIDFLEIEPTTWGGFEYSASLTIMDSDLLSKAMTETIANVNNTLHHLIDEIEDNHDIEIDDDYRSLSPTEIALIFKPFMGNQDETKMSDKEIEEIDKMVKGL